MSAFLQFLFAGITIGTIYALIALGFTIIFNASQVVNFAQGEFVMLGGMCTVFLMKAGVPIQFAWLLALLITAFTGVLLYQFAIQPAKGASAVSLIIITLGASIFLRGLVTVIFDKQTHRFEGISGDQSMQIAGASILLQSFWVLAGAVVIFALLYVFFKRSKLGLGVLAVSNNKLAAQLVGINTRKVMYISFALSAIVGAIAGLLITPIALTRYDIGVMLALKGFAAAMFGGMGVPLGALVGGLILGVIESFTAGYISSDYKDAAAFIVILVVLMVWPQGLFGRTAQERV